MRPRGVRLLEAEDCRHQPAPHLFSGGSAGSRRACARTRRPTPGQITGSIGQALPRCCVHRVSVGLGPSAELAHLGSAVRRPMELGQHGHDERARDAHRPDRGASACPRSCRRRGRRTTEISAAQMTPLHQGPSGSPVQHSVWWQAGDIGLLGSCAGEEDSGVTKRGGVCQRCSTGAAFGDDGGRGAAHVGARRTCHPAARRCPGAVF